MNIKKVYQLLLLVMFTSCDNTSETFLDLFSDRNTEKLYLVEEFPLDSLGSPDAILAVDDYWFFLEPKLEHQLTCYNVSKNTFSHKLMKGNGPDEFISVQTIGIGNTYDEIYLTDLMAQNVIKVIVGDSVSVKFSKELKWENLRFCDVAYDGGVEFALLIGEDKRFGVRDENGIRFFGQNITGLGVNPEVVSQVLQGPCIVSSVNKRIAWFSAYGDVMEVYDYKNLNDINLINQNVACLPIVDKSSKNGTLDFHTKMGVTSLAATDEYIYALYNERNLKEAIKNRNNAFFTNKILLFTWEGEPYKIVEVDKQIKSITYDKKNDVLLCLGLNENLDYAVYSFPLK